MAASPKNPKRKRSLGSKWAALARKNPAEFNRLMVAKKQESLQKGKLEVKKPGKPSSFVVPKRTAQEAKFQPKRTFRFNPKAVASNIAKKALSRAQATGKAGKFTTKERIKTNLGTTITRYKPNPIAIREAVNATRKKVAKGKGKLLKVHAKIVENRQKQAQQQAQQAQMQGLKSQALGAAKLGAAAFAARRVAGALTSIPGMLRRGGTYRF